MIENSPSVAHAVKEIFGEATTVMSRRPVLGGCINRASALKLSNGSLLFMKENGSGLSGMFLAEAKGLIAITRDGGPIVPKPLAVGEEGGNQFILMSYISEGHPGADHFETLGRGLARLHQHEVSSLYGFDHDNYIGATPQRNNLCESWIAFFGEHRLGYQISLAAKQGLASAALVRKTESLISKLGDFIEAPKRPSILHGDLWGGNTMADTDGRSVIFDPAAYFGHPEADLAMTELFGRFDPRFYAAYSDIMPISPEYRYRKKIYGLYHILNHLNLFGASYASQALSLLTPFVG